MRYGICGYAMGSFSVLSLALLTAFFLLSYSGPLTGSEPLVEGPNQSSTREKASDLWAAFSDTILEEIDVFRSIFMNGGYIIVTAEVERDKHRQNAACLLLPAIAYQQHLEFFNQFISSAFNMGFDEIFVDLYSESEVPIFDIAKEKLIDTTALWAAAKNDPAKAALMPLARKNHLFRNTLKGRYCKCVADALAGTGRYFIWYSITPADEISKDGMIPGVLGSIGGF